MTYHSSEKKQTKFTSYLHSEKEIRASLRLAKKEIERILDQCFDSKAVVFYQDKGVTVSPLDFPRMLSEWSRGSSLDHALRNLLISSFYSSEAKMGGSGIISAMMFTDKFREISSKMRATESDVRNILSTWQPGGVSLKIANEIFSMGACGCNVFFEEGDQLGTIVSCVSGLVQKGHIDHLMAPKFDEGFGLTGDIHIVAIDGMVEKIDQIHHVLQESKGRETVVMARGFLPDVSNTLSLNYSKNLLCIPFVVEEWCVDNFLDLQKIGIECVSIDTGGTISEARLPMAISASITPTSMILPGMKKKSERSITVSFGRDLGPLKGVSIDRTKLLLAIARFTSRTGCTNIDYNGRTITTPTSSIEAAKLSYESLQKILSNLGAVVVQDRKEGRNAQEKDKRKASRTDRL